MNPCDKTTKIRIKDGEILGEIRDGICIFRGIPYGGPVTGKNRFLPPASPLPWTGVLDCTENGPICPQTAGSVQTWEDQGTAFHGGRKNVFKVEHEVMDENCLVLNVVTPATDKKKRPVLFYIHGGGYSSGSGVLILGADKVATEEDVVLVSINHRIGPFGFLYLGDMDPEYRLSGIAGILDIVQALRWVQDNIAVFGGDPDQVTILGESGGGSKVSLLLSMDCTEGLFQRAVIESGATATACHSLQDGAKVAGQSLNWLGINDKECKRICEIPATEILALTTHFAPFAKSYVPVPDGEVMPFWNDGKYHIAEWARDVDVIIGSSEGEGAVLENGDKFDMTEEELPGYLIAEPEADMVVPVGRPLCVRSRVQDLIGSLTKEARPDDTPAMLYYKALSQLQFNQPALEMGVQYKEAGVRNVREYLVRYPSHHPVFTEKRFAWHTATLPLQMRIVLHEEDEEMSHKLCHLLMSFVKGRDIFIDGTEWIPFDIEKKHVLIIDREFSVEMNPGEQLRNVMNEREY